MADFVRVSLGGDMPSGEKWSINPIYRPAVPLALSNDEATAMATAIATTTWLSSLTGLNVTGVNFRTVRVEARNLAGDLESVGEAAKATPVAGSSATPHPFQTALCLSLLTGAAGASGKGRLYFPATGVPMAAATLRVTSTAQSDFLAGMNTWLASVRTQVRSVGGWSTAVLGVWSRTQASSRVVLSIRAGDIVDTQRRRRDAVSESYSSAAVAP